MARSDSRRGWRMRKTTRRGRGPWLRAITPRASARGGRWLNCPIEAGLAARSHMLGAPGRARAAHIMQFRPVGIEGLGEEGAPEGTEFGERLFQPDMAGGRGGSGS